MMPGRGEKTPVNDQTCTLMGLPNDRYLASAEFNNLKQAVDRLATRVSYKSRVGNPRGNDRALFAIEPYHRSLQRPHLKGLPRSVLES